MDPKFAWFVSAPDFVAVVFAYNFSFGLKIRVNWQKIHHFLFPEAGILGLCCFRGQKSFELIGTIDCGLHVSLLYA